MRSAAPIWRARENEMESAAAGIRHTPSHTVTASEIQPSTSFGAACTERIPKSNCTNKYVTFSDTENFVRCDCCRERYLLSVLPSEARDLVVKTERMVQPTKC